MSQIARELGISDSALYHWSKQLANQGEQAFPGSGHQTAQEEELRRLRRELEITLQERHIFKKPIRNISRAARWSTNSFPAISREIPSSPGAPRLRGAGVATLPVLL